MTSNHDLRRVIAERASNLGEIIGSLGISAELRIAQALIEEALIWTDRHIAALAISGRDTTPSMRRLILDIFDRIAAAIEAKNNGDNPAYDAHLAALDQQYSQLQGTEAGDASNITALQAGLQKIADAVNPPAPSGGTGTSSSGAAAGGGSAASGADAGGTPGASTSTQTPAA